MKKNKNKLDEMQEQKLLKIEHRCYAIAFWGLLIAIYFQIAIGNSSIENIGGESIVLAIMSIYMLVGCIKNGIWDRTFKPTMKTNIIISLVAGLLYGGFWFIVSYHNYHALVGSIATFVIMFIFISVTVFALLSFTMALYKRKKEKLDKKADEEESEE